MSAGGLDLVRNRNGSNKAPVLGKEQRRLALVGKAFSHGLVDLYAKIGHKEVVAGGDLVGALARGHAAAGQRLEVFHAAGGYAHLVRAGHDGLCQRVLAALLECGGELHQRLLGHDGRAVRAGGGQDIGHAGSSRGDGTGLVQHHGANAAQVLKRLGVLEQHAHLRPLAGTHHDGDGRSQAKRARAADNHHGDRCGEGLVDVASENHPRGKRHRGDNQHHGNKHAGDLVRQTSDGRFGCVGIFHQLDDLGQAGIRAHAGGAERERARAVDGRGGYGVAGVLLHGDRLAGQRALIDGACAFQHNAVYGHGFAGAHAYDLAG